MTSDTTTMHIGRKITRIRELRGMKQETLARELGVSQQAVSKLEQSEQVDDERLKVVAEKLGVSVETIKNFSEDAAINNVQNNYDSSVVNSQITYQFNSVEKLIEVMEENKKLYERLLQAEKEKNLLLEKMLELKK